jgi:DNA primase
MSSDHAREIKAALHDPMALCQKLGLVGGGGTFIRQGQRGVSIRCPVHEEKSPSCSVTRGPDGTVRVRCFGCAWTGDSLSLVAAARGLSLQRDFKAVLEEAGTLAGLYQVVDEIRRGAPHGDRPATPAPAPAPPAEPERTYPPAAEVHALLAQTVPCDEDGQVAMYLEGRGIDPEGVAGLASVLPKEARAPRWATYQGRSWAETGHRLIFVVRDDAGAPQSVRAGRVVEGDTPKRLPPAGHKAAGLVLADELGAAWLAGRVSPARVLVLEGETDWLTACQWKMSVPTARIAITSGSWTPALARRCRPGLPVLVWTDRDAAGDRYAAEIAKSLLPRGVVLGRWTGGRAA